MFTSLNIVYICKHLFTAYIIMLNEHYNSKAKYFPKFSTPDSCCLIKTKEFDTSV